jgi:hypothetical protein
MEAVESRILAASDTPGGPVTPGAVLYVDSISVINASTSQVVPGYAAVRANQTINLSTIGTRNLAFRANLSGGKSVKFVYTGGSRTESIAPFSSFGDANGKYTGRQFFAGAFSLTATPYAEAGAKGASGAPLKVVFTFTGDAGTPVSAPSVTGLRLVDATGRTLRTLTNGMTIKRSDLSSLNYNIVADVSGPAESVRLAGAGVTATENTAAYALFGNPSNTKFNTRTLTPGSYTFSATAFSQDNLKGSSGDTYAVTVKVV